MQHNTALSILFIYWFGKNAGGTLLFDNTLGKIQDFIFYVRRIKITCASFLFVPSSESDKCSCSFSSLLTEKIH